MARLPGGVYLGGAGITAEQVQVVDLLRSATACSIEPLHEHLNMAKRQKYQGNAREAVTASRRMCLGLTTRLTTGRACANRQRQPWQPATAARRSPMAEHHSSPRHRERLAGVQRQQDQGWAAA